VLCPLCERDVPVMSDHHLVPKSRGGTYEDTLPICTDCHGAIHALFDNRELESSLHTVEALKANEAFARHLRWLGRQDPGSRNRTARSRRRRR
jgi:5-methylcytosine-specific restriction enzyme A